MNETKPKLAVDRPKVTVPPKIVSSQAQSNTPPVQPVKDEGKPLTLPGVSPEEAPPTATIMITRGLKKWEFFFSGPVRRRDINRLQRQLLVEFNRLKRKDRMTKLRSERENFAKLTSEKEKSNAA